jgi:outer membrane protein OmpA-like peptidoglycan-associated protein
MLWLAVLGLWSLAVWPLHGHAQILKDCREGDECTAADLVNALFPDKGKGPVVTRGAGPQKGEASQPRPTAVALKVQFETNSDAILPQYFAPLNELGKALAQHQDMVYRIQIQGHTDSVGSEQYNQVLSQKRAESVKHYLVQNFPIKAAQLSAVGYGKSQPIASNDTLEGRGKNRRVQVVNLGE